MASSNFTTNLGLCDWSASDCPKRADFVSDNHILDQTVGAHIQNAAIHMSVAEKAKALNSFEVVSYQGDGSATRSIATSFSPKAVVVFRQNCPLTALQNGASVVFSAVGCYGYGCSSGLSISTTGFSVSESAASNGVRVSLNEDEEQYLAIVFK